MKKMSVPADNCQDLVIMSKWLTLIIGNGRRKKSILDRECKKWGIIFADFYNHPMVRKNQAVTISIDFW